MGLFSKIKEGLLKTKTILENITLFYDYTKTDIYGCSSCGYGCFMY